MHLRVWTVQDEETDDWIKNVVGEDGLTSREREMKLYAEMDKHLPGKHDQMECGDEVGI